jgi:hypothetical protein
MQPFFRYFGGKWKLAKRYGRPRCEHVIEPLRGRCGIQRLLGAEKGYLNRTESRGIRRLELPEARVTRRSDAFAVQYLARGRIALTGKPGG